VAKPRTYDLDDLVRAFPLEERIYRHRCVEAWAMVVPWTGFPLASLLRKAEPLPEAKYVRFVSFYRPREASRQSGPSMPWPYNEGLTLAEATNELTFLATGMYGHPLLKQHGAPVRLVVPWKYGFKSAKSIVRIELTARQPATFWNTLMPQEYDFEANVNPAVPHPRWSQEQERLLGTGETRTTLLYNGYGGQVAKLYRS
jgi:sulfoxide reductase catalytic subunit YedY